MQWREKKGGAKRIGKCLVKHATQKHTSTFTACVLLHRESTRVRERKTHCTEKSAAGQIKQSSPRVINTQLV